MILLKNTTDSLTITTTTTGNIDFTVSYADITTTTFAPGAFENTMPADATTTLLGGPAASTQRQVKLITIINRHATTTNTVLVQKLMSGPLTYDLTPTVTLLAHESMQYVDGQGWVYYASNGAPKSGNQGAVGSDKQVQFNNGGTALGADADLVWDKTNHRLGIGTSTNTGALTLGGGNTDQSVPAAGTIHIYTKDVASKMVPKWIGPSGLDNPIQPGIGFNGIKQVAPANGTSLTTCMTAFATFFTNVSATTPVQVAVTSTSLKTWMRSVVLATSTTAAVVASHFTPQAEVCGAGGYFFVSRFYVSGTIQSGQRGFHGLAARITIFTNVDPTTEFATAKVGLGYALTGITGNWKICASTTAAAITAVDTGIAVNNTDVLELVLFCSPNASSIGYRVTNLMSTVTASGTISGNIPATSAVHSVHHFVCNNATGAVASFGLNKWYLESDY